MRLLAAVVAAASAIAVTAGNAVAAAVVAEASVVAGVADAAAVDVAGAMLSLPPFLCAKKLNNQMKLKLQCRKIFAVFGIQTPFLGLNAEKKRIGGVEINFP